MSEKATLVSRFVVKRCDTERFANVSRVLAFLVPQMPVYDSDEPDGDPVADVIFDVQLGAIPSEFDFREAQDVEVGGGKESGVWLVVPENIEVGTVVDLEFRIVGVPA